MSWLLPLLFQILLIKFPKKGNSHRDWETSMSLETLHRRSKPSCTCCPVNSLLSFRAVCFIVFSFNGIFWIFCLGSHEMFNLAFLIVWPIFFVRLFTLGTSSFLQGNLQSLEKSHIEATGNRTKVASMLSPLQSRMDNSLKTHTRNPNSIMLL